MVISSPEHALITRGDFDWVLSKIEQDDSHTG
jgi:hypothetical protein